jgi:cytoskeletal protein RodZ
MKSEREKKLLIMKVGVITIIVLIFFLWVFNMRNIWRPIALDNNKNQAQDSEMSNFKQDVNKQMTEINKKLTDITDKKQEAQNKAGDDLLNSIIKDAGSATSSPVNDLATTSTSSLPVVKNSSCPAYVNCMPTIGEARPCQVPVGCEGVTLIAY